MALSTSADHSATQAEVQASATNMSKKKTLDCEKPRYSKQKALSAHDFLVVTAGPSMYVRCGKATSISFLVPGLYNVETIAPINGATSVTNRVPTPRRQWRVVLPLRCSYSSHKLLQRKAMDLVG